MVKQSDDRSRGKQRLTRNINEKNSMFNITFKYFMLDFIAMGCAGCSNGSEG